MARKSAAPTISCGSPTRRNATRFMAWSTMSQFQALLISVRNEPGMMQLTRTCGPKVWANPMVIAFSPALAAVYGITSGVGWMAAMLEMLMIDERRPSVLPRSNILVPSTAESRKGPFRLRPMTESQSCSLTFEMWSYNGDLPALLTRMSTPPS